MPFVCTPYDLQDLSVAMTEFPPRVPGDQRLFQGLSLAHYAWVKSKSRTLSTRPGFRERRRQAVYIILSSSEYLMLFIITALQTSLCCV